MSSDSVEPRTSPPKESTTRRSVQDRHRERRRFQRFPFNADAEVVEPESGTKIRGRVTDLSLAGCYVDTLNPFLASTTVHIRIARGLQVLEAQAKVAYCKLGVGMGLAFVSAPADSKKLLGNWIVELGGELPRAPASQSDGVKGTSNDQLSRIISELMQLLIQKGMLTETEREEILTRAK